MIASSLYLWQQHLSLPLFFLSCNNQMISNISIPLSHSMLDKDKEPCGFLFCAFLREIFVTLTKSQILYIASVFKLSSYSACTCENVSYCFEFQYDLYSFGVWMVCFLRFLALFFFIKRDKLGSNNLSNIFIYLRTSTKNNPGEKWIGFWIFLVYRCIAVTEWFNGSLLHFRGRKVVLEHMPSISGAQ